MQEKPNLFVIQRFLQSLFEQLFRPTDDIKDVTQRRKARLTAILSFVLTITYLIGILIVGINEIDTTPILLGNLAVFAVTGYFFSRTRYYMWGSIILVGSLSIIGFSLVLLGSGDPTNAFATTIPLAFVIGSVLLPVSGTTVLVGLNVLGILGVPVIYPPYTFQDAGITLASILTLGILLITVQVFRNNLERARLNDFKIINQKLHELGASLEQRVTDATRNLELAAEIGRSISLVHDIDTMLLGAVEIIRERFGLYYTQVYLTDPARNILLLKAGTGEVGQILLNRRHRLPIDMSSLNGIAATECRAVIVENTETNPLHRSNPLLPDTRSEMVVPLLIGEEVIGVLDMQSNQPGALSSENLPAFETVAGQVAIAVINSRLFAQAKKAKVVEENHSRRLTMEGWQDYLDAIESRERLAYTYDHKSITPLSQPFPDTQEENILTTPIQVSGVQIGSLLFERDQTWSEDDYFTVSTVAQQVAQQIENMRLLAQAERYQAKSQEVLKRLTREGWTTHHEQFLTEKGFIYHDHEVKPFNGNGNFFENALRYEVRVRDEIIGEINIAGIKTLTPGQTELVDFIHEKLSNHLENLRLSAQTEKALSQTEDQAKRLAALNTFSEQLVSSQSITDIFKAAGQKLPQIIIADRINIARFQVTCEDLELFTLQEDKGAVPIGTQIPPTGTAIGEVIQQRHPMIISDLCIDKHPDMEALCNQGFRSTLIVPLTGSQMTFGTLNFESLQVNAFDEQDQDLATQAAAQLASVLENRGLLEQVQNALAETEAMLEITSVASSSLELQTILTQVLVKVLEKTNANSGLISVFNPHSQKLEIIAHRLPKPLLHKLLSEGLEGTLCDVVYKGKQSLILEDFTKDSPINVTGLVDMGFHAYQGVPLTSKGSVKGTLCVFYREVINALEAGKALLEVVGRQIGVAIENANLYEQTQTALNVADTFRQLAEASGQGIRMVTMDGISSYVNPRMIEMLNVNDASDLIGKPFIFSYTYGYTQKIENEIFPQLLDNGNWVGELALKTADGSIIPTLENFFLLTDDDGNPQRIVDIITDITDRRVQEQTALKRAAELATVAELGTIISTILDEQQLLETVVKLTREWFDLYHCHIFLADEDNRILKVQACDWEENSPYMGIVEQVLISSEQEQSLVAQAARDQNAVIVNNVLDENNWLPNAMLPNTRSEMAMPLVAGDQILGVLDVQSDETNRFTNEDLSIMMTLASQIAISLQNARTHALTQKQAKNEALINLISQRIQSTTSVESALQVAIRELGMALGAKRTNIELGLVNQQRKQET